MPPVPIRGSIAANSSARSGAGSELSSSLPPHAASEGSASASAPNRSPRSMGQSLSSPEAGFDVDRSTLITSPLSFADFVLRLVFFAVAPFAIVIAATLFPVGGVLADLVAALVVLFLGEAARRWGAQSKLVRWVLSLTMSFEAYYRERPPRS